MKKNSLLLTLVCFMGLSQLAYANHHKEGESKGTENCTGMSHGSFSISDLDVNKDGNITQAEYMAGDKSNTEKIFKHIDANSDGKLDPAEQIEIEAVYKSLHKGKAKSIEI